jgi:hypothetical protein
MDEHPRALSPVEVAFQRLQRGYSRLPEDRQLPEPSGIQVSKSSHQKWRAVLGEDEGMTGLPAIPYVKLILCGDKICEINGEIFAALQIICYICTLEEL